MKLCKRGLMVAVLSVAAVTASASAASAFTGEGNLDLVVDFGSNCAFTISGTETLTAGSGSATVDQFSSTSCSGTFQGVQGEDLSWDAVLDASAGTAVITDEDSELAVQADVEVFFFTFDCRFVTSALELYYIYSGSTASLTFVETELPESGSEDCPVYEDVAVTVDGVLHVAL